MSCRRESLSWVLALLLPTATVPAQAPSSGPTPVTPPVVAPAAELQAPPIPRADVDALARSIDYAIDRKLQTERVAVSFPAPDAEFLRRVHLDLIGKVPTAERTISFLDDPAKDKRAKLIDELLGSSDFGRHVADIWQALLLPRNSENRQIALESFAGWLENRVNAGRPWDQTVRELLTVTGDSSESPAVNYFLANRELDKITDNVSRCFLGLQLQCAQCHNHPFTDWKQEAYWGMAAFFSRVRFAGNPRMAAQRGVTIQLNENGRGRPLMPPESAKQLPAKFLTGQQPLVAANAPLRPLLAAWVTSDRNPYFARAMVNRVWAELFGRGLVNPVDDMHDGNSPTHPELLTELAERFAGHRFDLKFLYRSICNSRAYERSSKPVPGNADAGAELYARMNIKSLTAEQLFDSLVQVIGVVPGQQGKMRGGKAQQMFRGPNANPRNFFVAFYHNEDGGDPTEYQAGIPQVLRLMNGPLLNNATRQHPAIQKGGRPREVIEGLYLSALSRRPSHDEFERMRSHFFAYKDQPRRAYADILWVLLNSSEFALNH